MAMRGLCERFRTALLLPAALLTAALAPSAGAQDDTASVAEPCLNNAQIRRTRILDDQNIVFITRSREIYNNHLPRGCPSLRPRSLINYPVTNSRVCAGYRFAVLMERTPGDFITTSICELGAFVPITEQQLEDLAILTSENRGRRERGRSRETVTAQPVELPPEDEAPAEPVPGEPAPPAAE